jgi:hypothetical protein
MSRKYSTALGIGAALGGAAIATFLSMGTAHADTTDVVSTYPTSDDAFQILFGAPGNPNLDDNATGLAQIAANETADANLTASNAGDETDLTNDAVLFESTGTDHALEQLIYAVDPSSFVTQSTPDIAGYLTGAGVSGDYLVPDDFLGYTATDLDFFLLSPLGLDPGLLGPLIDTLIGAEVGGF